MTSTYIREVYTDTAEKTQERSRELTLLRLLGYYQNEGFLSNSNFVASMQPIFMFLVSNWR